MHALLGDHLAMKPVLNVTPAELCAGQTQAFATDQGHTFGLDLANIARRLFIAIAQALQLFGVTENDVGRFMEQRSMWHERDGRDRNLPSMGISLTIAIRVTERHAIDQ